MTEQLIVYGSIGRDHHAYTACVDGAWLTWPAERDGWARRRQIIEAPDLARLIRLDADLARLALVLSGAPR